MAVQKQARAGMFAVALVTLVVLAGCSSIPIVGDSGPSCGPGEDEIGSITNSSRVSVEGELQSLNESRAVIDDGTGSAVLLALGGFKPNAGEPGDCVTASGTAQPRNESQKHDVTIIVINATVRT